MASIIDYYTDQPNTILNLKKLIDSKVEDVYIEFIRQSPKEEIIDFIGKNFIAVVLFLYAVENKNSCVGFEGYEKDVIYAKYKNNEDYEPEEVSENWDLSKHIPKEYLPYFYYILEYAKSYDHLELVYSNLVNGSSIKINLIEGETETLDDFYYEYNYMLTKNEKYKSFFYELFCSMLEEHFEDIYNKAICYKFIYAIKVGPFNTFTSKVNNQLLFDINSHNASDDKLMEAYEIFKNEYYPLVSLLDEAIVKDVDSFHTMHHKFALEQ